MFSVGCVSSDRLYYWGEYEDTIYKSYTKPGKMPLERQIEILEQDREKALAKAQPMPPGWHVHLGALYAEAGKLALAKRSFQIEKEKFPESSTLVDFFLKRMAKK